MNTTKFYRAPHNKSNTYLKISSQLINDKRLNAVSIGLMCLILSNSDTYILNVSVLKKASGLTRKPFYDAWNTLQHCQYVIQKNNGKSSYHYIINENIDLGRAQEGMPSGAQ